LDEIEKAHPSVSNVLLGLMDNGFVTGSNGKKADGRNAIVILTSNLGASDAEKNAVGFGSQERDGEISNAVNSFFKPEFRNRLDGIIQFGKLEQTTMIKIVKKFIDELNAQIKEKNVHVKPTADAVELLIKKGFNSKMGARPLARAIDEHIKKPLSREILFGKLINGGVVEIDVKNNELTFNVIEIMSTEKTKVEEAESDEGLQD
jgi:ATP-dependent Clp protease ATP-binding subunit ClpA